MKNVSANSISRTNTDRPTQPPPKPPVKPCAKPDLKLSLSQSRTDINSGKSSSGRSSITDRKSSASNAETKVKSPCSAISAMAAKRPPLSAKTVLTTTRGTNSTGLKVTAISSCACGATSTSASNLVNKKIGNVSVFKPAAIMKGPAASNKASPNESCVKTVQIKQSTVPTSIAQTSVCNTTCQDEKEHSGPVIFDPFDTIKREKAKYHSSEKDINRVLSLKQGRMPKPQLLKKYVEKTKVREKSTVKKTKVVKINNDRLTLDSKANRPKSCKKPKGKKKKTKEDDGDRITIISNKDNPSNFEFIGGRGWRIECNENNDMKSVKLMRCSAEDVDDTDMAAVDLPHYIHYVNEVTPTNKPTTHILPTHTSLDSDTENGFYSSYGMDNLSFDEELSDSDTDTISDDEITEQDIVFPISKDDFHQDLPVVLGLNNIIKSVVVSDDTHSSNVCSRQEPIEQIITTRVPSAVAPKPTQTSPRTSTSVDTSQNHENNQEDQSFNGRSTQGKLQDSQNITNDSPCDTPVAPPRRRSRKNISNTPPPLNTQEELDNAIQDLMKTTPHPSLNTNEAPHREASNLRKSIDSVKQSIDARDRFERELLNSQDGRSFKRINSYPRKKIKEPMILPPAGFTDEDVLEFDALNQVIRLFMIILFNQLCVIYQI